MDTAKILLLHNQPMLLLNKLTAQLFRNQPMLQLTQLPLHMLLHTQLPVQLFHNQLILLHTQPHILHILQLVLSATIGYSPSKMRVRKLPRPQQKKALEHIKGFEYCIDVK